MYVIDLFVTILRHNDIVVPMLCYDIIIVRSLDDIVRRDHTIWGPKHSLHSKSRSLTTLHCQSPAGYRQTVRHLLTINSTSSSTCSDNFTINRNSTQLTDKIKHTQQQLVTCPQYYLSMCWIFTIIIIISHYRLHCLHRGSFSAWSTGSQHFVRAANYIYSS